MAEACSTFSESTTETLVLVSWGHFSNFRPQMTLTLHQPHDSFAVFLSLTFPSLGLLPVAPPPPPRTPAATAGAPPPAPPAPLAVPPPLSVFRLSSSRVSGLSSSSWSESSPELKSSHAGGCTLRRSGTVASAAPPSTEDVNPLWALGRWVIGRGGRACGLLGQGCGQDGETKGMDGGRSGGS